MTKEKCEMCHEDIENSKRTIYTSLGEKPICEKCYQEILNDHIQGEVFEQLRQEKVVK